MKSTINYIKSEQECFCILSHQFGSYLYRIQIVSQQAAFEGIVGSTASDTIAIDDVDITEGPCDPPGYCDFDSGQCAWVNTKGDQFNWLRARGSSPSGGTGPSNDHTTGTPYGKVLPCVLVIYTGIQRALFCLGVRNRNTRVDLFD